MGREKSCNRNRKKKTIQIDNTRQQNATNRKCGFCDVTGHKRNDCTEVKDPVKHKKIMSSKNLFFNCLKYGHRAADWPIRTWFNCKWKHHTSLCVNNQMQDNPSHRDQETKVKMMAFFGEKSVSYPIVIVNANGIRCRVLVDTGAGSNYGSTALINCIGTSHVRRETRQIEMLQHTILRKIETHHLTSSNHEGSFKLNIDLHKVEKKILLTVPNPKYKTLLQSYNHLREVFINEDDTKAELSVNIVLGASNFSKIKTNIKLGLGKMVSQWQI